MQFCISTLQYKLSGKCKLLQTKQNMEKTTKQPTLLVRGKTFCWKWLLFSKYQTHNLEKCWAVFLYLLNTLKRAAQLFIFCVEVYIIYWSK